MLILKDKYVLHIPCVKWVAGEYQPVDYEAVIEAIDKRLSTTGIEAMYYDKSIGRYKGREYEQILVTVFCNEIDVGRLFLDVCRESSLQQEEYAYEYNGILYVCTIE